MSDSDPSESTVAVVAYETIQQFNLRMGKSTSQFLQGVYPFVGRGVFDIALLNDGLTYRVPEGKTAQIQYFRAGNLSDDLLYLTVIADDRNVRYFPVGPRSDFHVSLAIVESYPAGTRIEIGFAAPAGLTGAIVVDVGLIEMEAKTLPS